MSKTENSVRWAAVAAVGAVLLWQSADVTLGVAFFWSMLFCLVFAAAVLATMFLLAPDGWRRIERLPDLLIPLGALTVALGLLDWAVGVGFGLQTELFRPISIGELKIPVTVAWVLRILLHMLYATWMTVAVVEAVRGDRVDLGGALARSKGRFPRVFALLCPIWILMALLYVVELPAVLALAMWISSAIGSLGVVVIWLTLIGILAYRFTISLATAALLPVVVESRDPLLPTLCRGIAVSWRNRGRWWKLLLVQYLLLGAWISLQYSYFSSSNRTSFQFNANYMGPWLGDYANSTQWYAKSVEWLQHDPLALAVTLSALLSGLLSIVIKLAIVERYVSIAPDQQPVHQSESTDPALADTMPGGFRDRLTPGGPLP